MNKALLQPSIQAGAGEGGRGAVGEGGRGKAGRAGRMGIKMNKALLQPLIQGGKKRWGGGGRVEWRLKEVSSDPTHQNGRQET